MIRKIENIIRDELESEGSQEVLLPMVQPAEIWKESGRWQKYGSELLRFNDRKSGEFCLAPTHEEVITDLVRRDIRSWRQLPLSLYQIQGKFRDEIRPRGGLLRGREFIMKDAYTFDADADGALKSYDRMYTAYHEIFRRCGLDFRAVKADSGAIGGSLSHEFQVLAESGEDDLLSCGACDFAANVEVGVSDTCPKCGGELHTFKGIEVGHVFYLGTKYSAKMNCNILNKEGQEIPMEMGCYGIGVSRVMAAAVEQHHDEHGIIWPLSIAPFHVQLLTLQANNDEVVSWGEKLYREAKRAGVEVLYDDTDQRAGGKFKNADLIGAPYRVAIGGRGVKRGVAEVKRRAESAIYEVPLNEVTNALKLEIAGERVLERWAKE